MRKHYSETFKAEVALELLLEEKTVAQIASERQVHPNLLYEWKTIALKGLVAAFRSEHTTEATQKAHYEKRIDALYAEIGRLTTQVNWLKKKSGIALDPDGTARAGRA